MADLYVVGLGPGGLEGLTLEAKAALEAADLLCGYTLYIELIAKHFPEKECYATPMRQELLRCRYAIEQALAGRCVALVCSGDAGVYGMAGPLLELAAAHPQLDIEIVAGVTAASAGAAVLGAPLMHDFCVISLSDLLTDAALIERRLDAAGAADFVVCLYNPASRTRATHLQKACDILLRHKAPETVCGYVRQIGREGERRKTLTLAALREEALDMFTTVFVGNANTQLLHGRMVTPRGYEVTR